MRANRWGDHGKFQVWLGQERAVAARDELSWPMVGTVIALGAAAYALRGETLGDNEHV